MGYSVRSLRAIVAAGASPRGGLLALYRWALVARLRPARWLLAINLRQGFVPFWLWVRLGRWAGSVALSRAIADGVSDVAS